MDLFNTHRLGSTFSVSLSAEEVAGLEVAMMKLQLNENLKGKMQFWGKIYGETQDYLIVCHLDTFAEYPEKNYYFCTSSKFILQRFDPLKPEYEDQASKLTVGFKGDPSFFAYNGEEPESDDPEAPKIERFREIHRLYFTVKSIDNDCAIVPRGSYVIDASKKVIANSYYQGISYDTSLALRGYMHFRYPQSEQGKLLLRKPGLIKSGDFMDCIDKDAPVGIWTISHNSSGTVASVRSLYWEGYGFYSVINAPEYGGVYFGNGVANYDIAFML